MTLNTDSPIATRESWKTTEPSGPFLQIPYQAQFSLDEVEKIRRGIVPRDMEDKWFVFFESDVLYFHRSWTGTLIYRVQLSVSASGGTIESAEVLDDKEFYRRGSKRDEVRMLGFLVAALLLGKDVEFPMPSSMKNSPPGAYQHNVVGRAYPERLFYDSKIVRFLRRLVWPASKDR